MKTRIFTRKIKRICADRCTEAFVFCVCLWLVAAGLTDVSRMKIRILSDADAVAKEAARIIAIEARAAVAARGRFVMAVSGGKTPWQMLRDLAAEDIPWRNVQVVQVDERIAPSGDPDRNLTRLRESLLSHAPLRPEQIHAMPVEEKTSKRRPEVM